MTVRRPIAKTRTKKASVVRLVKFQKATPDPDFEAFIVAMFLMFARAPRQADPDADGFYSLGEIGAAPGKNWSRFTPYSLAERDRGASDCKCGEPDCIGHEVIDEQIHFPVFTSEAVMYASPHELTPFNVPQAHTSHQSSHVPLHPPPLPPCPSHA